MRIRTVLLGAACALLLAACGGSNNYKIPVDSSIKPFQKLEADEITSGDADPLRVPSDDDEDFEDPMADDDDDSAAAPKAPKTPAAAAKKAGK